MADPHASPATVMLRRIADGDTCAAEELLPLVYDELHRVASAHMGAQVPGHTLQPTALVHEAWMRLGGGTGAARDREHFLSLASRVMRTVLVDHARRRGRDKRGGDRGRLPLELALDRAGEGGVDTLELDEALDALNASEPDLARLVELRFFGGLAMEEAARALDVSLSTVERRWRLARMWLREALDPDAEPGAP